MSAATPPSTAPHHQAPPPAKKEPNELTIVSHSNLYYWWPVWACGFIMAIVTYFEGYVSAVVPAKEATINADADVAVSTPVRNESGDVVTDKDGKPVMDTKNHQGVVVVTGASSADWAGVYHQKNSNGVVVPRTPAPPPLHVSPHKALGVAFVLILLLVITITNVPLRGMWSVLIIVVAVAIVVIFSVLGWWETLLGWFWMLDIRINMGGYLTMSIFLFLIWLIALLVFDKQRYIRFTPGQFKVCDEIGGGEQVYSTDGMTLQKQRSDFFRHYILGLGSGDLIVRTAGAQGHHYDLPNVLFINQKVRQIEDLIARKAVVETQG